MASEDSLSKSMSSAIKHYSSLFFLPSLKKALVALIAFCAGGLILSMVLLFPSLDGLLMGISIGVSALVLTLVADFIVTNAVLRKAGIFVPKRMAALSLICWLLWVLFFLPGAFFGFSLWIKLCLLGFAAVATLRAVVFLSTSNAGLFRNLLASILHPWMSIVPLMVYWLNTGGIGAENLALFLVLASFLSLASSNLLVSIIDRLGQKSFGIPAMSLFRAFMLNWVLGENDPIERYFERMGENENIEISLLQFGATDNNSAIIVPLVHPGPFKNVGSSLLPSLLKHAFEKEFGGTACVPLGILGHELDLASQSQNQKIIEHVIASAKNNHFSDKATRFVKVVQHSVTVSCQIFGGVALLSFSLSPKTTEDLPQELGRFVREEAKRLGLKDAIVINAHNSMTDQFESEVSLYLLKDAALKCLDKAVRSAREVFEVGASTIYPEVFSLREGMGSGGITALAFRVADQKTALLVFDGNNMISGLRERILSDLASLGFDDGEVFTTDTHAVNALVRGRRGYHPVGDAMDNTMLLSYVKNVASMAIERLKPSASRALTLSVPDVRVIGKDRIERLSVLVDKALQKAKRVVIPIFGLEGLLLIVLLAVL